MPNVCVVQTRDTAVGLWRDVADFRATQSKEWQDFIGWEATGRFWRLVVRSTHRALEVAPEAAAVHAEGVGALQGGPADRGTSVLGGDVSRRWRELAHGYWQTQDVNGRGGLFAEGGGFQPHSGRFVAAAADDGAVFYCAAQVDDGGARADSGLANSSACVVPSLA